MEEGLTMRRWRDVLFAAVVVATIIGLRIVVTGPHDLTDLARFESVTGTSVGPESEFFASGLDGDGSTFAVIALDPLGIDIGDLLKNPSYRYMRFGYPWLAKGAALGVDDAVLFGLALVGMLSVGVSAFVASRLNEIRGPWAWLLVANPALILGALRDTAEPLGVTLVSLAIFSGSIWAGLALAVVRPTFLVALAGRWRIFLVACVVAGVSKLGWSWHFGESPLTGGFNLDWPMTGVLASPSLLGWAVIVSALTTVVIGVMKGDWAWVLSGLLVICLGQVVVDTPTNAVRAAAFLPVLWAFGPNFESNGSLRDVFRLRRPATV
jgi:hypothetical protein